MTADAPPADHVVDATDTPDPADAPGGREDGRRPSSRDIVHRTARRLFAERGYSAVSIRDIAAEAGVSPALVIKHGGSKQEMFRAAISFEPTPVITEASTDELGVTLVRRIVDAHRRGRPSPLTRAVVLVLPSPDPDEIRRRLNDAYLEPLTERLGGDPQARRRAENVLGALTGLSVSLRVFHYHQDVDHDDELVRTYGAAVQALVDG